MSDPEKTDPNFATQLGKVTDKVKEGTAKADPWFDRALAWLGKSSLTPWIIVVVVISLVLLGRCTK